MSKVTSCPAVRRLGLICVVVSLLQPKKENILRYDTAQLKQMSAEDLVRALQTLQGDVKSMEVTRSTMQGELQVTRSRLAETEKERDALLQEKIQLLTQKPSLSSQPNLWRPDHGTTPHRDGIAQPLPKSQRFAEPYDGNQGCSFRAMRDSLSVDAARTHQVRKSMSVHLNDA